MILKKGNIFPWSNIRTVPVTKGEPPPSPQQEDAAKKDIFQT